MPTPASVLPLPGVSILGLPVPSSEGNGGLLWPLRLEGCSRDVACCPGVGGFTTWGCSSCRVLLGSPVGLPGPSLRLTGWTPSECSGPAHSRAYWETWSGF